MNQDYHKLLLANFSLLNQALHDEIRGSELSPGQPKVFDYLSEHDGATQKEIAAGCYLTPGALTTILKRMEKLEMIERRREGGNMKEYHIYMTEKGRRLSNDVVSIFTALNEKAMEGLTDEECESFHRMFLKIYENYRK